MLQAKSGYRKICFQPLWLDLILKEFDSWKEKNKFSNYNFLESVLKGFIALCISWFLTSRILLSFRYIQ